MAKHVAPVLSWAASLVVVLTSSLSADLVGRIDTVGGTTWDWQATGPSLQWIVRDSGYGTHLVWMRSTDSGPEYPDRNMRYNFLDPAGRQYFSGDDTDYMSYGVNCFSARAGYGTLDVSPLTHCVYVSAHQAPAGYYRLVVARDAAPGAGDFEECLGSPAGDGYVWPIFGLTGSGRGHFAVIDTTSWTDLFHGRVDPWCTWSRPVRVDTPAPPPGLPNYNLATFKSGTRLAVVWLAVGADPPWSAFYRVSTDDGNTWQDTARLPFPPAVRPGTETLPSFDGAGPYPFYDRDGELHIVIPVFLVANGGRCGTPVELWHWTEASGWNRVYRPASAWSLPSRPVIGQGAAGELFCVWEQFDATNVEPRTNCLRADIVAARSLDHGRRWGEAVQVTDRDTTSKRFPAVSPWNNDSCHILYLQDLVAGLRPSQQGPATPNPMVYHRVPRGALPAAVAEEQPAARIHLALSPPAPSPCQGAAVLTCELSRPCRATLAIRDATGRRLRTLLDSDVGPGRHCVAWDGTDDAGRRLGPGILFCTLRADGGEVTRKLVLASRVR